MIGDITLNKIFSQINNCTPEYKQAIENRYTHFIQYTQLPQVNLVHGIDTNSLPTNTKMLYDNCYDIIKCGYGYIVNLSEFKHAGFLTSMLAHKFFENCILLDEPISSILYIDTNLLIEDYKKLMDRDSNSTSPRLVHSLDVLYKDIEEASFVFWDKFSMVNSSYAITKLYNILSVRYRNCLGNMFFITGGQNALSQQLSVEMLSVMNCITNKNDNIELINLERDNYTYLEGADKI